ncbi:hypothetical protein Tco_0407081 [Tanacetum coccineum]
MGCYSPPTLQKSCPEIWLSDGVLLENRFPDQMTHIVASLTLACANSGVMQGASCTKVRFPWLQPGRLKTMPTFNPLGSDWRKIMRKRAKKSVETEESLQDAGSMVYLDAEIFGINKGYHIRRSQKSVRLHILDADVVDQIIADQNNDSAVATLHRQAQALHRQAQALHRQAIASHRKAKALHLCK